MNWVKFIEDEQKKEYFIKLNEFIDNEYKDETIFPPRETIFAAFDHTPYDDVKVVILGQDPYHGKNQGHGLSFSVNYGIKIPPSLKNIYKELNTDLGMNPPNHGCLINWAKEGVLLLNTVLTVREKSPNSHRKIGWEIFTDEVIKLLNEKETPIVFILWGEPAKSKISMLNQEQHLVITSSHPSPFSARKGFFGSKCFSKANDFLLANQREVINWDSISN